MRKRRRRSFQMVIHLYLHDYSYHGDHYWGSKRKKREGEKKNNEKTP